jgi:hypothetical protein
MMKSMLVLAAVILVFMPNGAFAFGGLWGNRGLPLECQSRFHPKHCDHLWPWSQHHHQSSEPMSASEAPRAAAKACEVIRANVPAGQEIVIRMNVNADSFTASNDSFSETYEHNEKFDSEKEAVYEASSGRATSAPAKITITSLVEEQNGGNKLTIEWDSGNKESLDCPALE